MLLLLLLFSLLPVGNAQEEKQSPSTPENGYLLPKYPPKAARAYWGRDFKIVLMLQEGVVKDIWGIREEPSPDPNFYFDSRIRKALETWRFEPDLDSWEVKLLFRAFPTNSEEGKPSYYIYRVNGSFNRVDVSGVEEGDFSVSSPPKEITVEYH